MVQFGSVQLAVRLGFAYGSVRVRLMVHFGFGYSSVRSTFFRNFKANITELPRILSSSSLSYMSYTSTGGGPCFYFHKRPKRRFPFWGIYSGGPRGPPSLKYLVGRGGELWATVGVLKRLLTS